MYAMRTTRSDWAQEVFAEFDTLLKEIAETIIGTPLHEFAWQQACLSTSAGGLGLRSAAAHAPAAFSASASATWHLCKAVDQHFVWDTAEGATALLSSAAPEERVNFTASPGEGGALAQGDLSDNLEAVQIKSLHQRGDTRVLGSTPQPPEPLACTSATPSSPWPPFTASAVYS